MNSFDLLISLKFSQCLASIEQELAKAVNPEEISRLLIIANIGLMEEGSENVSGERPKWLTDSLRRLEEINVDSGEYYPVLLAFEASRLFGSENPEIAESLFEKAKRLQKSETSNACILFSEGIYKLNHFRDPSSALEIFNSSISLFHRKEIDELFLYFKFYSISMRIFALVSMGEYNQSIAESFSIIEDIKKAKFLPLLENCYLNLAQAYTGLADSQNALNYLEKNIEFWETSGNEKRVAVGLTIAAVSAISLSDMQNAQKYIQKRKATWIPLELHWNMISNALIQNGFSEQSEEWTWEPSLNATSA